MATYSRANSHISLVFNLAMLKTKVVLVKTVSIPRLKLCGAFSVANLINRSKIDLYVQMIRPTLTLIHE